MKWSWRVARVSGIAIYIHWTFLLLVAWILFAHLSQGSSLDVALEGVVFVLAVFACVVLHELGHALMAKRYDVRTRDITLLPIGGVARLERIPEVPIQELWVALAGPAVNLVIAGALFVILEVGGGIAPLARVLEVGGDFLTKLLYVNLILVAFNLLPAFPMDGGRVLRALLAMRMDRARATDIAASTGQVMAILFGILGLFVNMFLLFIALFVFLGAQQEAHFVQMGTLMKGVPVRDAMVTRFRTLAPGDPIEHAVEELMAGAQQDFPVIDAGRIAGMLLRADLLRALAEGKAGVRVGEVMRPPCGVVEDTAMLQGTFERMRQETCSTLPVVHGGALVGMVTLENVGEWMMVHSALRKASSRSAIGNIYSPD